MVWMDNLNHKAEKTQISRNVTKATLYFAEIDTVVAVFVDFADHRFERQVRLWGTDSLHHPLQLLKVNELVLVRVKTATRALQLAFIIARKIRKTLIRIIVA